MKMNFALMDFEDGRDASRIVDLANSIIEKENKGLINKSQYMTTTFNDGRKYKIDIDKTRKLVVIKREE